VVRGALVEGIEAEALSPYRPVKQSSLRFRPEREGYWLKLFEA
jgi:hypothetical protein